MRIMLLNTWYYPNMMGGAEQSLKLLAEGLAKAGHETAVLSVDGRDDSADIATVNGVAVYRMSAGAYKLFEAYKKELSGVAKAANKFRELWNPSIQDAVAWAMSDFHPDVVHCNCLSGLSLRSLKTIRKNDIPTVLTLRNNFMLCPFNSPAFIDKYVDALPMSIYRAIAKRSTKSVRAVTAPSHFTIDRHLEYGFFEDADLRLCIPNCVEVNLPETKALIEEKRGRTGKGVRFLFAGTLTEGKGVRHLLEAFTLLDDANSTLTLCGDGDLRNLVIRSEAENERIFYTGKLDAVQLKREYARADVLVAPSICEEAFGRTLIEANACGSVTICSDRGGMPEVVRTMKSGLIFEAGNVASLTETMAEFLNRQKIAEHLDGIPENITKFSLVRQIESYVDLYEAIS